MKTGDRIARIASQTGASLKSIVKIALQSRRCGITPQGGGNIIILANGPSLRTTIAEHEDLLRSIPCMAVNFAANAPEFDRLRPSYYVLADPHFFHSDEPNVCSLWQHLADASWPLTLYVPVPFVAEAYRRAPGITVEGFNAIGAEGFDTLCHAAFRSGRAMPRPRNVLIAAIMIALKAGFNTVWLTGADHSWLRTIEVNEQNEVVSVQPHFYQDDKRELARSTAEYIGYRLHDILNSFTVAFRSYHQIARYASACGVHIYNATPGSFIDAFERRNLDEAAKK